MVLKSKKIPKKSSKNVSRNRKLSKKMRGGTDESNINLQNKPVYKEYEHLKHIYPSEFNKFNSQGSSIEDGIFKYDENKHLDIKTNTKLSNKQKEKLHRNRVNKRRNEDQDINYFIRDRNSLSNDYIFQQEMLNKNSFRNLKNNKIENNTSDYTNIAPYYPRRQDETVFDDLTKLLLHRQLSRQDKNRMIKHFNELEAKQNRGSKTFIASYIEELKDTSKDINNNNRNKKFNEDTEFRNKLSEYDPFYVNKIASEIERQKIYLKGLDLANEYLKPYEGATYDENGMIVKPTNTKTSTNLHTKYNSNLKQRFLKDLRNYTNGKYENSTTVGSNAASAAG